MRVRVIVSVWERERESHGGLSQGGISSGSSSWVLEASTLSPRRTVSHSCFGARTHDRDVASSRGSTLWRSAGRVVRWSGGASVRWLCGLVKP